MFEPFGRMLFMHTKVKEVLDSNKVIYKIILHKDLGDIRSSFDFSRLMKIPINLVYKTLFLKIKNDDLFMMAVLPAAKRADLKKIAKVYNFPGVEFAPLETLVKTTSYEKFGTTAIGTNLPTVIHSEAKSLNKIYIATGTVGEELEITSKDFISITKAKLENITE